MRKVGRVVRIFLLSLLSTAVLAAATAIVAAVSLAATAVIVPGTGTPNANNVGMYMENFRDYYMQRTCSDIDPANGCDTLTGVNYPASFWPIPLPGWCPNLQCDKFDVSVAKGVANLRADVSGVAGPFLIAGYSQGARVATIAKMQIARGAWAGLPLPDAFTFIGNPNRPNGGILSRFGIIGRIPILDVTTGQPTPTNTGIPTDDYAIRWEGIADWPQYLLNPLAIVNSILGFVYDHGTYLAVNADSDPGEIPAGYDPATWQAIMDNPQNYPAIVDIQTYGDTTYYTITPKVLPLVRWLHDIPLIGKPIADFFEPILRVVIEETGYNRAIPFGYPIGTSLIPWFNPISLFIKLVPAVLIGINNFFANFGLAKEIPLSPTTPGATNPLGTTTLASANSSLTSSSLSSEEGQDIEDPQDQANLRMLAFGADGEDLIEGTVEEIEGTVEETPGTVEEIQGTVEEAEGTVEEAEGIVEGTEGTVEGTEGTVEETEGTIEETVQETQGTVQETQGTVQETTKPEVVTVVDREPEKITKPEEKKDLQSNRVDANGGSVSLNFSTNKTNQTSTKGDDEGPDPVKPVDDPAPTAGPATGPTSNDDSDGSSNDADKAAA
ncbi:PE-PPE domain-containing protein [Mycobacterium barrassiae]|uniref:PE-PPE domain-containing protein n=1 Tax=Mycobacterium barrassiae TaxID=319709 RepID=UPI002265DB37|nr:PE-PPE domain-containing protein [Mycobacterium barrassiae]MCV7298204.1 PE-PPE domain-containing protein [Mycobacterium barrassiae]